jgi:ketosteroid isomerase-like protein
MGAGSPEEMVTAWEKVINAGDIDGVLAFYGPEAVMVRPKEEGGPVNGPDGIRQVLGQFLALDPIFTLILHRATESGQVALIVGDWSLEGTGPDGSAVTMNGRFRDVLHRQSDGSWLIAIDNPFGDD